MIVGKRIKALREYRGLTQGSLEKKTGLLRCYISRVEHEHLTPSLETLEKFAEALDVPLYAFFCDDENTLVAVARVCGQAISRQDQELIAQLARLLPRISSPDRQFLMRTAERLSKA